VSEWEVRTPARGVQSRKEEHELMLDEAQDIETERDWYGAEEATGAVDLEHNELASFDSAVAADTSQQQRLNKKLTALQAAFARDNDRWERNRLQMVGGLIRGDSFDASRDEDHQTSRVQLVLQDAMPQFLLPGGSMASLGPLLKLSGDTTTGGMVDPFKDPTSDMAVIARKGSPIVRSLRERKERQRLMRTLEGHDSKLGQMLAHENVREDGNAGEKDTGGGDVSMPKSTSSSAKTIQEQRQSLPAYACRNELLQLIRENQVVVIVGETGSGKTTQLAQYLFEDGYCRDGSLIGCTQPRRVAAMSVAKRVSEEMGVSVGSTVGYAIRFEDCTSPETRIKYMTDGVLLRETLRDTDLDQYATIIIDEAHERSLQTDVLLGLLRRIIQRRRDLRLIVTSATMNADRFSSFFGRAPVYTIPGRTFPVEILFAKNPVEDYVEAAVKQALAIHLGRQMPGDMLIFMTGQEDVEATCELLRDQFDAFKQKQKHQQQSYTKPGDEPINSGPPELLVLPMYSQLPADLQARIFEPTPGNQVRKCIVATNIAETSLTVDGIVYVIDPGYGKQRVYNPRIGMDALQIAPVSQAGANQRAGRAGRTGPGVCFRLYTETAYKHELHANNIPEIQRTNLANVLLLLQSLGIGSVLDFDFLDPPPGAATASAAFTLWGLGALSNDGRLTGMGRRMVEFPLDPPLSVMLLAGEMAGCAGDIATIVSMLSVPSIFFRPRERAEEADAIKEKFAVPESDHLTLLNVYNLWSRLDSSRAQDRWCTQHFVHAKAMRRAKEVRDQLVDIMKQQGIEPRVSGSNWDSIRKCIAHSYAVNKTAKMKSITEYVNLRTGLPCTLHPTSSLLGLGFTPEYVVYHELVMTSKEYMHCVTAVDPSWLAEAAPMFYHLRVTEFSASGNISSTKSVVLSRKESFADEKKKIIDTSLFVSDQPESGKPAESTDELLIMTPRLKTPRRHNF